MILRVPGSAARWTLVFTTLVLAAALAYPAIRNARAVQEASRNKPESYTRATQLEPSNPLNWYLLGRYWQYNLEEPDARRAVEAYRTSLALDPRSASVWLDLATAYESEGDIRSARDAFLQATRVYPISGEVSWRYGNFLLRQGELPQAFAQIRHAVSVDPKRAAEAFSRSWRVDPDVQVLLDKALPPNGAVYLDAIRELVAGDQTTPALTVWSRLVALRPPLHLSDILFFTDALLQARRTSEARRVWNDAVTLSATPPPADPPGSVVWDGGFETGISDGGFAWHFPTGPTGVQTNLDSTEKHSGNLSLRLTFDGKHNVNFSDVCSIAEVQPATRYRFSAWIHTQALTSEQGIRFRFLWLEGSQAASLDTPEIHGTQPWTQLDVPWIAGDTRQVRVCVTRNPSGDPNTRIEGTAWIDDVALVPVPPEKLKP